MKVYRQARDYTCGPAVVRTILGLHHLKVPSEAVLMRLLKSTNEHGTHPRRIAEYLCSEGLHVSINQSTLPELKGHLRNHNLAILDTALWGGHYVLALDWQRREGWQGGMFTLVDSAAWCEGRPDGFTYLAGANLDGLWFDPIPPTTKRLAIYVKL